MSYASALRNNTPSTSTLPTPQDSLCFTPRVAKQPLYRPAVLRHNSSNSESFHLHSPSPPLSPAASSTDLNSSWLSSLASAAPWNVYLDPKIEVVTGRGSVLPRSQWKPDDEAVECCDTSCSTRFGLTTRKHHCRRCGQIFCSTHSSHSIPLWTNQDESSAPPTPRVTPHPSALDIPSLLHSSSSRSSSPSPSLNSSLRRSSPPSNNRSAFPVAISCRVCDRCAFFNPYPSQITPLYTTSPSSPSSAPLSFRHPSNSTTRTSLVSPGISPPYQNGAGGFQGTTRSRHNSGSSSSDPRSLTSTAPSSVEAYTHHQNANSKRGVSPATSATAGIRVVNEEESESEDEEEEYNEAEERERRATFGSVIDNGEFSWQSRFATF